MEIVETYPIPKPMSDLLMMHIYYIELRACNRLPRPIYPYPDFEVLRVKDEGINDIDVVPHGLPMPVPLLVPTYEPALVLALIEGLEPEELNPKQQNAFKNPPDLILQ